jgi:polyhydroxybutyrate depolymerase
VDRDRVFLTGYSNGGMLTYLFTCDHADLLAGAASIAGTNLTGCDPSDPVSFLQVSGTDDEIVPVDGGESKAPGLGPFPSVVGSVEGVAAAQRCGSPARTTADSVTSTRWSDCEDGTTVGLDLIAGADHTEPIAGDHPATPLVLAFWGLAGAG